MDITVSGQHVAIGEALREHVETRLTSLESHYNSRMTSGKTVFTRGPHDNGFHCTITILGPKKTYVGEADSSEAHGAFDRAYEKVAKQVRRKARERKDISHEKIIAED